MNKQLTNSNIDRQNILNNQYAINEIEKAVGIEGILFEGSYRFTKQQIAEFYSVDDSTIKRYIKKYEAELTENGYDVLRAKRLKVFKLTVNRMDVRDIDAPNIEIDKKAPSIGIFDFRAFLNIGMLLTESEIAKELRRTILDIVIDTINKKTGGGTKYINQRDRNFVLTYFKNENYRQAFTDTLRDYVDMGNFKYPLFTDKIYKSIFKEKSNEYRKILKLEPKDNVRKTLYSEILILISSFEFGFSKLLKKKSDEKGRKLSAWEVERLYSEFENQPHWKPLLEDARVKMASRDLGFRDALHLKLQEYLAPIPKEDFEKFLGTSSMNVEEQLEQFHEVFKRLKERE
ncbi:MAG: DNA-binding protein [Candidatus Cloacimonetes bacterium]|nr:DNA-binding protein [Candidatus Cloacimonadota bacterium]